MVSTHVDIEKHRVLRSKQTDLVPGKGQFRSRFPQSAQLRLSDNDFSGSVRQRFFWIPAIDIRKPAVRAIATAS